MLIWYHGTALSFFHTYRKKVQTFHVWRQNDVIIVDFAQIADLQWNIGENFFSPKNL